MAGQAVQAPQKILEYLGNRYEGVSEPSSKPDDVLFTGETYRGMKVYIPAWYKMTPYKIPRKLVGKLDDGTTQWYDLVGKPQICVYAESGKYNRFDEVRFGLGNHSDSDKNMRSPQPWFIARGPRWKPVFTPVTSQVITPLKQGEIKEFSWDQKVDGNYAGNGSYRIIFSPLEGEEAERHVDFSVQKNIPSVLDQEDKNYDHATANDQFFKIDTQLSNWDMKFSEKARDELVSLMQCKAYCAHLDPLTLRWALFNIIYAKKGQDELPFMAASTRYKDRPSWAIVFQYRLGKRAIPHYYIVDKERNETVLDDTPKT